MSERVWPTEREFFNARLKCGDLPRGRLSEYGASLVPGCGASDWRVLNRAIFDPHDRELICRVCGATTLVTVEKVGDEVNAE